MPNSTRKGRGRSQTYRPYHTQWNGSNSSFSYNPSTTSYPNHPPLDGSASTSRPHSQHESSRGHKRAHSNTDSPRDTNPPRPLHRRITELFPGGPGSTPRSSTLNSPLNDIHIQDPSNQGVYDPSNGPRSPVSINDANKRQRTQSGFADNSPQVANLPPLFVERKRGRDQFDLGMLISAPFHTPNTNPNTKEYDPNVSFSTEGPVYTKR